MAGKLETNPNNPLNVQAGQDKFSKIDEPDGAAHSRASLEELWQAVVEKNFQKVADAQNVNLGKFMQSMQKYSDERVDNMRR